jgi:hypothetical protein
MERRKHTRFSATAFLNRPVALTPMPPYIGKNIRGKLIDLSAGGLALLIPQIIPLGTKIHIKLTFPDQTLLECDGDIRHMSPRDRNYLHGLQFDAVDADIAARIERMSADYIDCEQRIANNFLTPCVGQQCAFFTMCTKAERTEHFLNHEEDLLLSISRVIS